LKTEPQVAPTRTEEIPGEMVELIRLISNLPAEQRLNLEPAVARVLESTKRRRRILALVQEALSQLRLDMKYLVFDLEATRRERDAYRHGLDQAE
jgi:hypothetical protein